METTAYLNLNGTSENMSSKAVAKTAPAMNPLVFGLSWCTCLVGVIGFLANTLVIFALSGKKLQKRTSNVLIRSQVFFDLLACACLILSYGYRVLFGTIPLSSDLLGNFICIAISGNGLLAVAVNTSLANLGIIAFERYVKIVHLVKHRNYFKRWMLGFAIAFCVVSGLLLNIPFLWTSGVINGVCIPLDLWPSRNSQIAYIWIHMTWQYLLLLVAFVFCYGNIVKVVRKRMKVTTVKVYQVKPALPNNANQVTNPAHHVQSHAQQPTNKTQDPSSQVQNEPCSKREVNVVKTMIIIALSYAITNFPSLFFSLCWAHDVIFTATNKNIALYNSIVLVFFYMNICLNPFIYVASHKDVKKQLKVIFRMCCVMSRKATVNDDASKSLELS